MKRMIAGLAWSVLIALGIHVENAGADVIVDNTSQSPVGYGIVGTGQFEGQEFNTGNASYALTSVVAQVGASSGTYTGVAELVTDNGGTPAGGTVLTTFSFPAIGASFANETFIPTTSGVVLNANTNYWFVLATRRERVRSVGITPGLRRPPARDR